MHCLEATKYLQKNANFLTSICKNILQKNPVQITVLKMQRGVVPLPTSFILKAAPPKIQIAVPVHLEPYHSSLCVRVCVWVCVCV